MTSAQKKRSPWGWLDRLVPSDRVLVEAGRLARRIGAMLAESIAAVKEIVDTSLGGIEDALVAESTRLTRLAAEGGYRSRTERFLAAWFFCGAGVGSGLGPA